MRKYNKNEYNREYNKKKYKQLKIYLSADEREQIQSHAAKRGEAVGAFLKRAAAAQIERDRAKDERRAAEPGTAGAGQSRPTSDERQTAAEAPEDSTPRTGNAPAEISTTGNKAELKQDSRTTTAPAPKSTRRGRPPKQTDRDPAQLTLDGSTTDSGSGRG